MIIVVAIVEVAVKAPTPPRAWVWGTMPFGGGLGNREPGSYIYIYNITYGPRKAMAEVSNHNEPIGRKSGIQLVRKIRKSMDFTFSCFVLN